MSEAIGTIWRRPLRTALTVVGIVIGVLPLRYGAAGALSGELATNGDGGGRVCARLGELLDRARGR